MVVHLYLCVPVNLRLNIDFFQVYLNVYSGESEVLYMQNVENWLFKYHNLTTNIHNINWRKQ